MRVVVTGSRDWGYPNAVHAALTSLHGLCEAMNTGLIIRHGACPTGADKAAWNWFQIAEPWWGNVKMEQFPADWQKDGRAAGPLRNIRMFDDPVDLVLAFWDGRSKGTEHTIKLAETRHILTIVRYQ